MKVRFQADNAFKHAILYGVLRREPSISFQTAIQAQLSGLRDPKVLAQAADEGRLLVTYDRKTMPRHFAEFVNSGNISPGVILISQKTEVSEAIYALLLVWAASEAEKWCSRIVELPFE